MRYPLRHMPFAVSTGNTDLVSAYRFAGLTANQTMNKSLQKWHRINGFTLAAHFKMEVRPR